MRLLIAMTVWAVASVTYVVFFTLTDRASTIPSNMTWLPIRYVVCWTEKYQRNIYKAPTRAEEKHKQTKTTKRKEQIPPQRFDIFSP